MITLTDSLKRQSRIHAFIAIQLSHYIFKLEGNLYMITLTVSLKR